MIKNTSAIMLVVQNICFKVHCNYIKHKQVKIGLVYMVKKNQRYNLLIFILVLKFYEL